MTSWCFYKAWLESTGICRKIRRLSTSGNLLIFQCVWPFKDSSIPQWLNRSRIHSQSLLIARKLHEFQDISRWHSQGVLEEKPVNGFTARRRSERAHVMYISPVILHFLRRKKVISRDLYFRFSQSFSAFQGRVLESCSEGAIWLTTRGSIQHNWCTKWASIGKRIPSNACSDGAWKWNCTKLNSLSLIRSLFTPSGKWTSIVPWPGFLKVGVLIL